MTFSRRVICFVIVSQNESNPIFGFRSLSLSLSVETQVGSGAASAYTVHDTFSFKITLPPKSRRIEFCVCFKCDIGEFWDNHDVS